MRLHELYDDPQLNELDLKKAAQTAALGLSLGAAGVGGYNLAKQDTKPAVSTQVAQPKDQIGSLLSQLPDTPVQVKKKPSTSQIADTAQERYLMKLAQSTGIKGDELAAFMAQMAHESFGFKRFIELGDNEYFKKIYDIKGSNPKKAEELGNLKPGDGARYKGRGYVHLTGKDNYRKASKALGVDLIKNPDLAAQPEMAAKIALWFWHTRVRPNVDDWDDVRSVTRKINRAMQGIEDREANYHDYLRKFQKTKIATN